MAAAPAPLSADLEHGLRRLKLASMRRVAPELLVTAKTQRWTPEELLRALVETEMEWRYDMGSDTVVGRGHLLEYDREGRFRSVHLNTKLDAPLPRPDGNLDDFYRGRRWLTEWFDDPTHQVTFRLEPGDVMFMDNHRVLHGRTPFDPTKGARHLQGAYIDHDGPNTMFRLATRRLAARQASDPSA